MADAKLEAIFRNQMAAYADCDVDRLLDSFTSDCILRDMADPERPFIGKEAVRAFLEGYFATLRDVVVEVTSVAVADGVVIGELEVAAHYVGTPFSEDNYRPVQLRYCIAEEIRDGYVANERFYWDSQHLAQQLQYPATTATGTGPMIS